MGKEPIVLLMGTNTLVNGRMEKERTRHLYFGYGDKKVGEYKDGKRNGQGTLTFANGDKYEGEYKDGKSLEQGIYSYANGDKYVGEFQDGQRQGQGTLTLLMETSTLVNLKTTKNMVQAISFADGKRIRW